MSVVYSKVNDPGLFSEKLAAASVVVGDVYFISADNAAGDGEAAVLIMVTLPDGASVCAGVALAPFLAAANEIREAHSEDQVGPTLTCLAVEPDESSRSIVGPSEAE